VITLLSPSNSAVLSILSGTQKEFIRRSALLTPDDARKVENRPYSWLDPKIDEDDNAHKPASITLMWKSSSPLNVTKVHISTESDFSVTDHIATVAPIHYCSENDMYFCVLNNLLSGQKYYWKITCGNETSETRSFSTVYGEMRTIRADGVGNVRDIGGRVNRDGRRIKQGLIFRGAMLNNLTKPECSSMNGLGVLRDDIGIKTDIDLRWEAIGKYEYCQLGDHINYNLIPAGAYEELLNGYQGDIFIRIFDILADENTYPIYFHCVSGADRTGCIGAMLDAILGMSDEDIILNYNITSLSTVRCWYTNAAAFIDKMNELFPGCSLAEQLMATVKFLGISDDTIEKLRNNLLE